METIYKVNYTKMNKQGGAEISLSLLCSDKAKAIAKCEEFGQRMRNVDFVVSRYAEADFYIWIREYKDNDGILCPVACYPYESIEDGVLKTPHLSVHHNYFNN